MSPTAHDRSALAKFQDGEERLVYARLRADPDAPLYFLEDGTAREVRAWAKQHLVCFMPDCGARQLTTVSRATRRDGFSHRRGAGGHARESLFHQQAKALIGRWVSARYRGEVTARLEQATESGERRADVMLTWPSGQQLAVEIQYAALTPTQWRARHESYLSQGLSCMWLLGHLPPNLREARGVTATSVGSGGAVALSALHQAMIAAQVPLMWINPIEESVGTVWTHADAHECEDYPCRCPGDNTTFQVSPHLGAADSEDFGFFGVDPLARCDISPEGLQTPTTARLAASLVAYVKARRADNEAQAAIRAERLRREAEMNRQRAVLQRVASLRASRADEEDQRIRRWLQQEGHSLVQQWQASSLYADLTSRYGAIPDALREPLPNDVGVQGLAEHWHAVLYEAHIQARDDGARFTIGDCYKTLRVSGFRLHGDGTRRGAAVVEYLEHLAKIDLVHIRWNAFRPRHVDYVRVLGDLTSAPGNKRTSEAARAARLTRERDESRVRDERRAAIVERRRRLRERERAIPDPSPAAGRSKPMTTKPNGPSPDPSWKGVRDSRRYTNCIVCGGRLADILEEVGYHIGCRPRT
ncbi:competence protein CoiA family protein [Terrabacter sp. GCM10028922]|uniref:competence protein CoiA family protein n=1 Tax=Terrabacter sp. GCM10028922 TaxID=3273428 RepID=UPI003606ACDF